MNTRLLFPVAVASVALFGAGCFASPSSPQAVQPSVVPVVKTPPTPTPEPSPIKTTSTQLAILHSNQASTKYCNGENMDSDGYRKTITQKRSLTVPADQTASERAASVIVASTDGMCQQVLKSLEITVKDGAVHIPRIEGWAGISIAMCSCKPQVEVNALRLPGVTKVIWEQ